MDAENIDVWLVQELISLKDPCNRNQPELGDLWKPRPGGRQQWLPHHIPKPITVLRFLNIASGHGSLLNASDHIEVG
jgi:hypothetical protein